jgi:3'-5' exoribonuclease
MVYHSAKPNALCQGNESVVPPHLDWSQGIGYSCPLPVYMRGLYSSRKDNRMNHHQIDLFSNPKTIFVNQLSSGQIVNVPFAVTHMTLKTYTGGKFLQMKLGDRTGRIPAVLWGGAEQVHQQLQIGDLVQVQGLVEVYREKIQLNIKKIEKIEEVDSLDPNDYIPSMENHGAGYLEELKEIAGSLQNPSLKELLQHFFEDTDFIGGFLRAPGGKQWHHGYLGGLVEHTLGVVKNCVVLADRYPFIKRDVLITGAIFHDLGKILEFSYSVVIEYSDIGRLVGHQILSDNKVCEYAARIPDFPQELLLEVRHLILSHHGDSPDAVRPPSTREALILSRADDLDAQMNAFTREILKARMVSKKWSDYVNLINRYLYDSGGDDDMSRIVLEET